MAGTEDVISMQLSIKALFDQAETMETEFQTIIKAVDFYIDVSKNKPVESSNVQSSDNFDMDTVTVPEEIFKKVRDLTN